MWCGLPTGPRRLITKKELIRFFIPLALQSTSQSLTYPLVAIVASRGDLGPLGLAGLAQSNMVMFLLSMFGAGIPSAGMVFGRTKAGWMCFFKMNLLIGVGVCAVQGLLALPPASSLLFGFLIGLPPAIEEEAKKALAGTILLQFLFFARNPYQVALLVARESAKASAATLGRIVFTVLMTGAFTVSGWGGVGPAIVCLTLPVALEVVLSAILARPYLKLLVDDPQGGPSLTRLLGFVFPLSGGGMLLALSGPLLGAFISRANDPEKSLYVYYLAMGLASPMAFSASRIQSLVLAFLPLGWSIKELRLFALQVGLILGIIPLVFVLPPLAQAYYVSLQKLPAEDLPLLRVTALTLMLLPLCVAIRSYNEGVASWQRKPGAVLAGQMGHLFALTGASYLGLSVGLPGNLLGPVGLICGNLAGGFVMGLMTRGNGSPTGPMSQRTPWARVASHLRKK